MRGNRKGVPSDAAGIDEPALVALCADPVANHRAILAYMSRFGSRNARFGGSTSRVVAASGGRKVAEALDVAFECACDAWRVDQPGDRRRLVGVPFLHADLDDRSASARTAADIIGEAVVSAATDLGIDPSDCQPMPFLANLVFLTFADAFELGEAISLNVAAADPRGGREAAKAATALRKYNDRVMSSFRPDSLRFPPVSENSIDRHGVVAGLALILVPGHAVSESCRVGLKRSEGIEDVWMGGPAGLADARADATVHWLLAEMRGRAGMDPLEGIGGGMLHRFESSGRFAFTSFAFEAPNGAVSTLSGIERSLGLGPSLERALTQADASFVEADTADSLPNERKAGERDPAARTEVEVADEAFAERRGWGRLGEAVIRAVEGPDTPKRFEGTTVGQVALTRTWHQLTAPHPKAATIREVLKLVGDRVAREKLRETKEPRPSDERVAAVSKRWVELAETVPLLELVSVDPGMDWQWVEQMRTSEPPAATVPLEDGRSVCVWLDQADSQGSVTLAFRYFNAVLVTEDGEAVSWAQGTVVRQRNRGVSMSRKRFLFDMDAVDDEMASFAVRFVDLGHDPDDVFERGDMVHLAMLATKEAHRRRGCASALVRAVLSELKRRYRGLRTLVVPLHDPGLAVTPPKDGPADLRMLYLSGTAPARRMFQGSSLARDAFGPQSEVIVFDRGMDLTFEEFALATV